VWKMTTVIRPGFHTYPLQQPPDSEDLGQVTAIIPPEFGPFVFVGTPSGPVGRLKPVEGKNTAIVEDSGDWEWRFFVHPKAEPGKYKIPLRFNIIACDDKGCLPLHPPEVEFEILGDAPVPVEEQYRSTVDSFSINKPVKNPVKPPANAKPEQGPAGGP